MKLDYTLETTEERKALVDSILAELESNGESYELSLPYNPSFAKEGESYNFEFLTKVYKNGRIRTKVLDFDFN